MTAQFDPDKDTANRFKHKLSLAFGDRIFLDPRHEVTSTIRIGDEEDRYKVIGMVDGKLYTAVFVWRNDVPRYISVRRSNDGETRRYRNPGGS